MKCESCGVKVGAEFTFAIQQNQCPACGKCIMQKEKLSSYLSLCALLKDSGVKEDSAEKIAAVIVANFELKQIFNNVVKKSTEEGNIEVEENTESAQQLKDSDGPVIHNGIRLEKIDKNEAKKILQQMRDEALSNAVEDRYGVEIGNGDILLPDAGASQAENLIRMGQEKSRQIIETGLGGKNSFRRSE